MQPTPSPLPIDRNNDFLQNEMLQNEIHSLNNEISLLLTRVKLSEQSNTQLLTFRWYIFSRCVITLSVCTN